MIVDENVDKVGITKTSQIKPYVKISTSVRKKQNCTGVKYKGYWTNWPVQQF
jgi:hypothetical protein